MTQEIRAVSGQHVTIANSTRPGRFLKLREVKEKTSLASSTIYRKMEEGKFPKPRRLSEACVRWLESDIESWMDSLPSTGSPTS
jgi:prophage regulatory protein